MNQIGTGTTELTGDSSGFAGMTSVEAGTLAVNGSLCGLMEVLSGGRLQGTGTVCDTTNFAGGTVAPGNSIGTITVNGDYAGNGGTLEIEAVLGGDASPADLLAVTGNTSGSTNVQVINLGGTGAQTVEGIKIVDVGGASDGDFTLLGDFVIEGEQAVVAGAYGYTLQQNGVSTPDDGDWYLRSALIDQPGPLFQPGVPLYENYAQVLLGLNGLSTFQQRVGNRYRDDGSGAMASASPAANSGVMGFAGPALKAAPAEGAGSGHPFWVRVDGNHTRQRPSTTTGSNYDADQFKMQAGLDALLAEKPVGRLFGALTAQYGTVSADIDSVFGDGKIGVDGYGFGGTLTWLGDSGFYLDGQGQASWFDSDLSSDLAGRVADGDDAFGYAFSIESGKRSRGGPSPRRRSLSIPRWISTAPTCSARRSRSMTATA